LGRRASGGRRSGGCRGRSPCWLGLRFFWRRDRYLWQGFRYLAPGRPRRRQPSQQRQCAERDGTQEPSLPNNKSRCTATYSAQRPQHNAPLPHSILSFFCTCRLGKFWQTGRERLAMCPLRHTCGGINLGVPQATGFGALFLQFAFASATIAPVNCEHLFGSRNWRSRYVGRFDSRGCPGRRSALRSVPRSSRAECRQTMQV
jgi:hypothetical protein